MKHLYLFCLLCCLCSCEFHPKDEVFTQVDSTAAVSVVSMDLLNAPDTIVVLKPTQFKYNIGIEGHSEIKVNVQFDGRSLHSSDRSTGTFEFSPRDRESGMYTLVLSALTNSGTGSLADVAGAEKLLFERKYTVVLDTDEPTPVAIKSAQCVGGYLRIEWEKYTRPNFQNYHVTVDYFPDSTGRDYSQGHHYYITDRNQTVLVDTTYAGGRGIVSISVTAPSYNSLIPFFSPTTRYPLSDPPSRIVRFESLPERKLKITWNRNRYDGTFRKYVVYDDRNRTTLYETANINDTVWVTDRFDFGVNYTLQLITHTQAPNTNLYTRQFTTSRTVYYGEKSAPFQYPFFSDRPDDFYALFWQTLTRHQGSQFLGQSTAAINTVSSPAYLRPNGAVGVSPGGNRMYAASGEMIQELDPESLAGKSAFSTRTVTNTNQTYPSYLAVSDAGQLFMFLSRSPRLDLEYTHKIVAYNVSKGSATDSVNITGYFNQLSSNRSGNRLLYEINGTSYLLYLQNGLFTNKTTPAKLVGSFVVFNPVNEQEIIACATREVKIYDTETLQVKRTIPLSVPAGSFWVDKATGNIGCKDDAGNYSIFSSLTGQLLRREKLFSTTNREFYYLHNNVLYSPWGMSYSFGL